MKMTLTTYQFHIPQVLTKENYVKFRSILNISETIQLAELIENPSSFKRELIESLGVVVILIIAALITSLGFEKPELTVPIVVVIFFKIAFTLITLSSLNSFNSKKKKYYLGLQAAIRKSNSYEDFLSIAIKYKLQPYHKIVV